ncbi:NAD(P)(+) transhydrogenase (Re/Si-specific) subunit beta [Emcibacter sp.]|uniref:NAD(P)(+) transhydrogenase (Re/Si-specific) subunit beta n=1 Tax=Emcibacter sp. TaxID=1979954 RepID=UPI003A939006
MSEQMIADLTALAYLVAGVLFIMSLRGLSSPETSRRGNNFGMLGMAIAVITTVLNPEIVSYTWIIIALVVGGGIGLVTARRIAMTDMPQLVAAFHSLVGLAAVLVAGAAFAEPRAFGITDALGNIYVASRIEMALGAAIGAITFSGSVIAFAKLNGNMSGKPILLPARHLINGLLGLGIIGLIVAFSLSEGAATGGGHLMWYIMAASFVIGFLIIIPIGGADMPVVVSMLNSYSGWAAAGIGFTLGNNALIVTGALVGSSGAILSYIMCTAMNRSFISVILGGFGGEDAAAATGGAEERPVKQGSAEDAAFIMKNAGSVIIVPGYGMAVAKAQHALKEMAEMLKEEGVKVSYAIHPVAGRMPGHMNVLLAEADVPYDEVFELEDINSQFSQTDVAFVIGANDVTNPAAKTDKTSPIYGMPVLDVENAGTVLFVKRGMAAGYAGVQNELFFRDNTMMLFADAKKMVEDIVKAL